MKMFPKMVSYSFMKFSLVKQSGFTGCEKQLECISRTPRKRPRSTSPTGKEDRGIHEGCSSGISTIHEELSQVIH